jgi:aspartyl-tRNA(Asn)/glutamyl-tRNA(Gln) amidotransferase subunit C
MNKDDTIRIANLARIELTEREAESFTLEINGILTYVDQVKQITGNVPPDKVVGAVFNVMREDTEPHPAGQFTEDLLALAPKRKGQYVEVKKILEEK